MSVVAVGAAPRTSWGQEAAAPGRFRDWVRDAALSPGPYVGAVFAAAMDHRDNDPAEWGRGARGYSRRALSKFGMMQVQTGIEHGVAAIARHQVGYRPCGCDGVWRRVGHAIAQTVVTRSDAGNRVPNIGVLSSRYGSALVARTWRPDEDRGVFGQGLLDGHVLVGGEAALNVVREFANELKRLLPGR